MFPVNSSNARNIEYEQKPVPAYAKWGSLAMKETKQKYPNAQIIDYLHVGRIVNPNSSSETFKLWLREGQREFGVYITIEFDTKTEKLLRLTFKETSR
nr:YqzG/YhdC family protein [Bacillus marasmi]